MSVLGKTSNAFYFNGVSDSITCPVSDFKNTGVTTKAGAGEGRSSRPLLGQRDEDSRLRTTILDELDTFTVEAWIRPDYGGVVAQKDDLFTLIVGGPKEPSGASFTVSAQDRSGTRKVYRVDSAKPITGGGYNGVLFPVKSHTSLSNNDMSRSSSPLIHVAGVFTPQRISLIINGVTVASRKIHSFSICNVTSSDFIIGGKGGQYKGYIESVHWRKNAVGFSLQPAPFVRDNSTLGLWRFEEDIEVDNNVYYIKSNVSVGDTTLTLDSTQIQTMYRTISGKSDTFTGTYTIPSLGKYKVAANTHSGGAQVIDVDHTPWNLIINPTCSDTKTGLPNNSAPERVRVLSLNASTNVITVSSVHLDFETSSDTGSRGVLHARTAFHENNNQSNDSACVLVKSDLLIDAGTDDYVQMHGMGSQAIDTTGIVVHDEGPFGLDGYLFNRKMSINESTNAYTISSANWGSTKNKMQIGHTGRHCLNYVAGHDFLSLLPQGEEVISQTMDGLADVIEVTFDGQNIGVKDQLAINSEISVFRSSPNIKSSTIITSSKATQVIRNGLSTLDPNRDSIIAIGGANFDVRPFLLKGYPIDGITQNDDVYDLHLAPETVSRIALLETGDSDFPLVEVHYNAIDLTGDIMGGAGPCLLVEKTVPDGGSIINSKRVADTINSAISGGMTLHAAGGLIQFSRTEMAVIPEVLYDYSLNGDNTGGTQYEMELDTSKIPSRYTPLVATDAPRQPPIGIPSSHSSDPSHASVYHRLIMRPNSAAEQSNIVSGKDEFTITGTSGNEGTGNLVNRIHEVFDIITNYQQGKHINVVVQPSNRSRSLVLNKIRNTPLDPLSLSVEYLITRGRVSSFSERKSESGSTLDMVGRGLMDDVAAMEADYSGEGAPDSTIVKEVSPDAPVVSVTLGGPGQGAVLTQPTWDKSTLSRLGWSNRRDGGAAVKTIDNTTNYYVEVTNLNNNAGFGNNSDSLDAGGHFAPRGRLYVASGANFEYYKLYQGKFYFHSGTGHVGTGRFKNSEGIELDSFSAWESDTGLEIGSIVVVDDKFDDDSIVPDGTTINDRLFQSLGSVTHDYQLGTQYASTRAMVEIPVFSNQFFSDARAGTYPSAGNSMKLHIDATMTAHSWAPNPVGRRPSNFYPVDRDVEGPYHVRLQNGDNVVAMKVNKVEPPTAGTGSIRSYYGTWADSIATAPHTFTITDARGTEKTYKVVASGTSGDLDGTDVIIGEDQGTFVGSGAGWATNFNKNFKAAIESTNGHAGSLIVEDYTAGETLILKETIYGNTSDGGNITHSGWSTSNAPTVVQITRSTYTRIYSEGIANRLPAGTDIEVPTSVAERKIRGMTSIPIFRRVFTPNGEWGLVHSVTDTTLDYIDIQEHSKDFLDSIQQGSTISLLPYLDFNGTPIRDDPRGLSSANEFRRPYYHDRSNVQTQGGNIDYGLRQYVSAVEFKAGPESNPHSRKIRNKTGLLTITQNTTGSVWAVVSDTLPITKTSVTFTATNIVTGASVTFTHNTSSGNVITVTSGTVSVGDELAITSATGNVKLNRTWNYPYAPGGLREGDTVWMNMHYTNPHAIDGMFCKSRGVFNQYEVWEGFNSGEGALTTEANSTLPLENFLIGNTCRETAANFVQHVNKTVSLNWQQLGYTEASAPVVAYIDPYLDSDDHARVLLYDVGHDREFIAFHDLFMQVQTGQATPTVNGLDVAAGFKSQVNTSQRSSFIEGAYSHRSYYLMNPSTPQDNRADDHLLPHYVDTGTSTIDGATGRLSEETVSVSSAETRHEESSSDAITDHTFNSTFFDTPDGTRVIPAFLCMKGIRSSAHNLSSHAESRLTNLPHWTDMDFVRRQIIDFGEIGSAEGVVNVRTAAEEIVRKINQNAALQASSRGGSAHDPAAFWHEPSASSKDRGTHMGYVRAHIGREVKDLDGNEGYSIIIHSTIPGASGRNFCVWLDNSTGQVPYKPEYLIGHGGRFRNSWCMPPEGEDENMHPAPMPINKHGRPFAPITTLRQLVPVDEDSHDLVGNLHFGYGTDVESSDRDGNDEMTIGRAANTVYDESFEPQAQSTTLVEGLRTGTRAYSRINFGGLVASGVPGWAPDAGKWGFGEDGKSGRFDKIYNAVGPSAYTAYVPTTEKNDVGKRELYGFTFTDHRGIDHTIRMVYKQEGVTFATKDTQLPSTLDNEVIIHFDDRDVAQGGFTVGKNMQGSVHPDRADFPAQSWRGNEWRGVKAPANGYAVRSQKSGSVLTLHTILSPHPSDTDDIDAANGGGAIDTLGFLGFPDSGLLVYTDVGSTTTVVHYTSRTHNDHSGPHKFYGVTGPDFSSASTTTWATSGNTGIEGTSGDPAIISPSLNWTTILTDEVIAAAVEHAMLIDPNNKTYFDISDMYATDGRTFKEWMGENAKTAVCITTMSDKQRVTPLRDIFDVERRRDLGLLASCLDSSTAGTSKLSLTDLEAGKQDAVGYLPYTLLNVRTKSRGPNSNTATPLLVNSANQAVNTAAWKSHLTGDKYTAWPGDHILPSIETHVVRVTDWASQTLVQSTTSPNARHSNKIGIDEQKFASGNTGFTGVFLGGPMLTHNQAEASYPSYLELKTMYVNEDNYALGHMEYNSTDGAFFTFDTASTNSDGTVAFSIPDGDTPAFLYSHFKPEFAGYRLAGNMYGEPLTYFRGGQASPDHSVPLYFGGGFSGLVMDINDGTQNDYTEFYSHPYAAGPTGCAGLQNVGESMGAHAILDTTAMLAMFPATSLLNQHRGEHTSPFANADAILAPDLKVGTSAQTLGISSGDKDTIYKESTGTDDSVPLTHPTPVVLRFAHPYARYTDTVNEVAYVVFGPGQSVPKHFNQYTGAGTVEPAISQTVANKVTHVERTGSTNIYYGSGTVPDKNLPNPIARIGGNATTGIRRYMPSTLNTQKANVYPYSIMRNWEPAYGSPNAAVNQTNSEDAYFITTHFGSIGATPAGPEGHPFAYSDYNLRWHMDAGFPAGGNWFDYAVRKNPPHPTTTESTKYLPNSQTHSLDGQTITLGLQASMFRVGYVALTTYDSSLTETTPPDDVFIVDATRVQNSEELGAVISAAINSYPGAGNLKAIGGTFLPSFQDAVRQDRYAWVSLGEAVVSYDPTSAQLVLKTNIPPSLPENGWLRLNKTSSGSDPQTMYGYYSSFSGATFTLGANARSGTTYLEDPDGPTSGIASFTDSYEVFVWTKAGNLRWSNGAPETLHNSTPTNDEDSIYDQLATTQVHFSGFVDAIDRTRPIGAVGWHGERYSMLNSLVVPGTSTIASGLGAWHPMLGTNPYGAGMSCHALNGYPFTTVDEVSYTPAPNSTSTGVHPRHYVIISNEAELPIIARADRDGLVLAGDMLDKAWNSGPGGTVEVSHSNRHNDDRFVSYAHGGPHVDAQFAADFAPPSSGIGEWATNAATSDEMVPMETCIFPTGDLFFDKNENPGVQHYPDETPLNHVSSDTTRTLENIYDDPFSFWGTYSAARNFLSQHIVWKRMDGGNLCMPSPNARGLGALPWVWRKVGSNYYKQGETIYGNNRFSFETTNSSMFPIVQAQELMHPHLAEQFPIDVKNVLMIPNEHIQFEAVTVVDDAGVEHKIEGGSPFGTIVRDFQGVSDRDVKGPALAGSGNQPPIQIRLPDPDTIPGNLVVRSGYDRVQAYQHETMGTGGLQRPDLPDPVIQSNFDSTNESAKTGPFFENEGYERIDTRSEYYPYSREGDIESQAMLETSYEPHDRGIFFHLTKKGFSYTERQPLGYNSDGDLTYNSVTFSAVNGTILTVTGTPLSEIWRSEQLPDGRSFFTVNGHVVSFTGISGSNFTGCKYSPDFAATAGDVLLPSFFIPTGSTRHFASRRLRDHSEVSGESPDKAPIDWMGVATTASPAVAIRSDRLTPMPLPRMGHHYVTPTMAMLPGHLAHPLYQRLYTKNRAYKRATQSIEQELGYTLVGHSLAGGTSSDGLLVEKDGVGPNALMWFSSTSAPHPPSDIHGSGFTLMTETKLKYDGYGILSTGTENTSGGHRLSLEAGTNYRTHWNFPDPMEVGAYQIIIQPNLFSQQLMGFSENYNFNSDTGSKYPLLTDQQVATVIALQWNGTDYDFILAEAIQADVRGCEVYLNEVMLDIDPSPNQQFTSLPPLALYNPLGINENTSPIWSRKSLPYHPGMFRMASPGYTLTVPWWVPALKSSTSLDASNAYRMVEWHRPEDYYLFSRSGYGSVGSQSVMTGYPSHFIHPYTHSYMSHIPTTTVKAKDQGNSQLIVLNNSLFPEVGSRYMGHCLVVIGSDGTSHKATYTHRGVSSGASTTNTNVFYGVTPFNATKFWAACVDGATVRLTGEHGTYEPGAIYTDKTASVLAHIVEDIRDGTRDTITGHLPDAYLSMWHYNLGRPMTFYSDSRSNLGDAAVDKKPYNHMPEHYETIRYQNFTYAISDGPFDFRGFTRSTTSGPTDNSANPDTLTTPQSRTDDRMGSNRKYHYGAFWPGGSRFGAQASDLSLWGTAGPGWGRFWDNSSVYQESSTAGQYEVQTRSAITDSIDSVTHLRNASFGYRFCVRQAPNRPKWALWSTQAFDDKYSNNHSGYRFGVYVQSDSTTTTLFKYNSGLTTSSETTNSAHVGMLERLTNASALVGSDLKLQQVRYSHGRRMTRPYGCAVRNYIAYDEDTGGTEYPVLRAHQGDWLANIGSVGSASLPTACTAPRRGLAPAIAHYMTDWWGNTTGEEVRRFPVRGFGVRPAWDPEDAYRATDRTKTAQAFASPSGNGLSRADLDFFDPATAKRVGDRGDGRGVRWPTQFNEDMLQDVDIELASSGLMISDATAQPPQGVGYVRDRNDDLQDNEVVRGISRRLAVAADDGLLKPEAMAGSNVEASTAALLPASENIQEPISRIAPRIGLDITTVGEINDTSSHDYVALGTEAHSLHTDRGIGRRYILDAGVKTDNKAVDDYRLNSLNFSSFKQVMRLNHTHGLWPMGGNLIMDLMSYMEPISTLAWGNTNVSGSTPVYKTTNPYQSATHNPSAFRINQIDKTISFLLRPVRVLDHRHIEIFRDTTHALSGTAGGRYGVYTYDTPNARADTSSKFLRATNPSPTNAPYPPVYFFTSASYTSPSSTGPRIPATEGTAFSVNLKQAVARIVVANNTLQHFRADASRNGDFSIQPRYTQTIYAGDDLNISDHSSESNRADNEVDGV